MNTGQGALAAGIAV